MTCEFAPIYPCRYHSPPARMHARPHARNQAHARTHACIQFCAHTTAQAHVRTRARTPTSTLVWLGEGSSRRRRVPMRVSPSWLVQTKGFESLCSPKDPDSFQSLQDKFHAIYAMEVRTPPPKIEFCYSRMTICSFLSPRERRRVP
eukprot:4238357-Pleurochrysis_carterae.AAC.1